MECYQRPNRSDVHLSAEAEASIEAKTREYFDEMAPKRHTKPQRSEYSTQYMDAFSNGHNSSIPELQQFQLLENEPQEKVGSKNSFFCSSIPELQQFQLLENEPQEKKLVYNGNEVTDEFVETEYYKDLNSVDKHHHTTGTGFIKVDKSGKNFHIEPDNETDCHPSCKCNPATNDWVPAPSTQVGFNSDKPSRSDN